MTEEQAKILLLGNPLLRKISDCVEEFTSKPLIRDLESLHNVLIRFREEHGFGRGMAAPQLGILKRVVALNLNGRQTTMINPEIIWSSPEEFSLWDDCMCFPDLLVRVKRNSSITVQYQDEAGKSCTWDKLDPATSELLQHEIDHLNGILAIDRAIDKESISYRINVEKNYT
jgi:peptide deformylase